MSTATAPSLTPAARARLAAEAAKISGRLDHLGKLLPIMIEKTAFYRGKVAEAESRRSASALMMVDQHLRGTELDEARLSHNLRCLQNSNAETAGVFATVIDQAVLAARAEHADCTTKLANIERQLAGAAA
jgi:hypothetical protein